MIGQNKQSQVALNSVCHVEIDEHERKETILSRATITLIFNEEHEHNHYKAKSEVRSV